MSGLTFKTTATLSQTFFFLLFITTVVAQPATRLTIDEAYQLARNNYPLVKQKDLINKTKEYSVSNASKGYLPAFSLNGQATYQSTVTNFPFQIPGFAIPQYDRDQYKVYAEVNQVVYDGGIIKNQQQTAIANEQIQQQNLAVELYKLYDRVNQLFFGALLMDEQLHQNDLLKKDIQNGIDKAKALVANGTAYRSSVDELSAQLLQAEQSRVEIKATKKAYADMLGLFINSPINDSTIFEKPFAPLTTGNIITRPELIAFDYQKQTYDLQGKLLNAQLRPRVSLFAQGAYGRPGLNVLSNNFTWYYIGGLKFNWNFGSLYTYKNQLQLLDIGRKTLDIQKETFLFNTSVVLMQQDTEVKKYLELIQNDNAIIGLRESVKKAAVAQLENGVLSAHDYINQVIAEDQVRQNLILHEVLLLQAQYNYQNTAGNINPSNK